MNLIERIFGKKIKNDGKIIEDNNELPDNKFKVKVEPFGQECNFYFVKYSFTSGRFWDDIKVNVLHDSEILCSCRVKLWSDFDEAVTFAKSLNPEKVKEYIQSLKDEYDYHILKLRKEREKRNKTFES